MSRTTALILARGGSKGLPGKNIRLLHGKPLIHYTIEAALHCSLIDAVYVSTDDPEIAEVSRQAGALLPPPRPAELATDTASSMDVVKHFIDWHRKTLSEIPENLVLLQPTSPLRNAQHLAEAMTLYLKNPERQTVVSVCSTKPIAWQGFIDSETQAFQAHQTVDLASNRQKESANYVLNGAIYIAPTSRYERNALMSDGPVRAYVMPPEASVDIDTLMDFRLAECLLADKQNAERAVQPQTTPVLEPA